VNEGVCYWIVTLIAGATGVAAGVVVIAIVAVPVTVRLSVPLVDGFVVVSPRYCALIAWVPTVNAGAVGTAVPPETVAAVPIMVVPSNSWTCPVGVPPVTATLNVNGLGETTLALGTVNFVTVAIFGGGTTPPPAPLHPAVRPSMQTSPSPSTARYFLRPPGRNSRKSAANPEPALSVHQPLLLVGLELGSESVVGSGMALASSMWCSRKLEAVSVVEVAATWQLKVPVAVPFAGGVIAAGAVHVTPGGRLVGRVTVTGELKPLVEVIVIVDPAVAPVAEFNTSGVELSVKVGLAGAVTLKAVLVAIVKPAAVAVSV